MAAERTLYAKEEHRRFSVEEGVDIPFLLLVGLLLVVGLTMLYSASSAQSQYDTGYTISTKYLQKQAVCAVLGLVCMVIFEQPQMSAIISAKWSILYLGVLSSGVAYTLQIVAQKRSDPTLAVIILSTESMFSVIGGVMFGIDKLTLLGVVGCVLMFAGIIVSQINIKLKRKKENN